MPSWSRTLGSSIGAKAIMAATGLAILLFVTAHLLGNLQIYLGPEPINRYAAFLKSVPEILWAMRVGLAVVFVTHIASAVLLTFRNRAARPVRYAVRRPQEAGLPSRTLLLSGLLVLAFVIYHLAHFTLGLTHPEHSHYLDEAGRHDVYRMMILGFRDPAVVALYLAAMTAMGFHLWHAVGNLFQTLGWSTPRYRPIIARGGRILAVALVLGNCSIPLSVLLGIVTLTSGGHG
jgi:succinate dehydrogenase / fumarate reductase cytochrome b subunit